MNEFSALDMLRNDTPTDRIEFGTVVEDEFGLGLRKRGKEGFSLLSGQSANDCLTMLEAKVGDDIVVFYQRGLMNGVEVVLASEMGFLTPAIEEEVRLYLDRKAISNLAHGARDWLFSQADDWF